MMNEGAKLGAPDAEGDLPKDHTFQKDTPKKEDSAPGWASVVLTTGLKDIKDRRPPEGVSIVQGTRLAVGSGRVEIFSEREILTIEAFNSLCQTSKDQIEEVLSKAGLITNLPVGSFDNLKVPKQVETGNGQYNLVAMLDSILKDDSRRRLTHKTTRDYTDKLEFDEINKRARQMADYIRANHAKLVAILTQYETHEVAHDEIARTLDLLENLEENRAYFKRRIGLVGSYLPMNQPLYAFACFSMIPALMSEEVLVRPPVITRNIFDQLGRTLDLDNHFPNIMVSDQTRGDFNEMCKNKGVEVVIFTGKMENAYKIKKSFSDDVLFIINGAGHNPIVVSEDADIEASVVTAMDVQLYNQGQDCAGPSAILVHRKVQREYMESLRAAVKDVMAGPYSDPRVRVGPIGNPKDLPRIAGMIDGNRDYIDPSIPGGINHKSGIVQPVIINRPLEEGGNYVEQFAPIFFVHGYKTDEELHQYFGNEKYSSNAMYVSLFGSSDYVEGLVNHRFSDGRPLHGSEQIVRNKGLHTPGVERGTQPYGGYGRRASCLIVDGREIPMPTLPQRDIFEQLVEPALLRQPAKRRHSSAVNGEGRKTAPEKTLTLKASRLKTPRDSYLKNNMDESRIARVRHFTDLIRDADFEADDVLQRLAYEAAKNDMGNVRIFFRDVYNLLLGVDNGPRISTLIRTIGKQKTIELLNI